MKCLKCGQEIPNCSEYCCHCGCKVTPMIDEQQALNNIDEYCQIKDNISYKEPVLSVSGLFSFKGRRNRKPYFILGFTLNILNGGLRSMADAAKGIPLDAAIVGIAVVGVMLYIQTANIAKRLQDINFPGFLSIAWTSIIIVSLVISGGVSPILSALEFVLSLILLFKDGTVGPNKYGPDPLNRE